MNKATKLVILSGIVVGIGLAMTSKQEKSKSQVVPAEPSKAVATMPSLDNQPVKVEDKAIESPVDKVVVDKQQ